MSSFTDVFSRQATGLRYPTKTSEKSPEKKISSLMKALNKPAGASVGSEKQMSDWEMRDESGFKQEIKQETDEPLFPTLPNLDTRWTSMYAEKQNAMEFNANGFDSTFRAPTLAEKDMFSTTDNNKFTILLYPKKLTIFPSKFSKEGEFRSFAYITLDEMRSRIKPRGGEWDMFMGPATVRGSLYPQLLLKIINAMHMNVNRLEIEVIESDFENGARTFKLTNQKDFC